ncbi:hypothetical protein DNI29_06000 [Hymenobacter sediminis]|uniref:hypothetical protein n=1 Tax=Hymenobacter sediminis TaxID=2218621 RepID=UPI000DA694D4|nr:hypothetical protein [Hymenobacter sediminis]RPD50345.1 hypothetical protein DNI29_06000 [Hymenobacter sediminis]
MQQKFTQEAEFRQERDFGQKIGATFEFLGAHWKPLGKCIVYFVLPISLLIGVGMGLMFNPLWDLMGAAQAGKVGTMRTTSFPFSSSYFGGIGLVMIGGFLAFTVLLATVYSYIRLLVLYEPTGAAPTPSQVWQQVKQHLGKVFLAFLFFFGLYLAIMFGGTMVIGLLAQLLGSWAALLFFAVFIGVAYVVVPLALYFPVLFLEERGVVNTLPRCFALIRGKWWSTFGVVLVAGMIQGMISILFMIPQYAIMFGKMLHLPVLSSDVVGIITQCLYSGGIMLTYPIPLLAALFQYFNLVEKKEGYGLRQMVMNLGGAAPHTPSNSVLRPDDEGEY